MGTDHVDNHSVIVDEVGRQRPQQHIKLQSKGASVRRHGRSRSIRGAWRGESDKSRTITYSTLETMWRDGGGGECEPLWDLCTKIAAMMLTRSRKRWARPGSSSTC
eukprot:2816330-Rhodomonas_salina.2